MEGDRRGLSPNVWPIEPKPKLCEERCSSAFLAALIVASCRCRSASIALCTMLASRPGEELLEGGSTTRSRPLPCRNAALSLPGEGVGASGLARVG